MTPEHRHQIKPGQRFTLVETASLGMAESVMSNYTSALQAVLDLVDNAVDNRIEGTPLSIDVHYDSKGLTIRNRGGKGLDLDGLQNYLQWGYSDKSRQQIGQYGVGGKAAAGFLGKSLEVICSPQGSSEAYRLVDPNWTEKHEQREKEHHGETITAVTNEGYFIVKITNLERGRNINSRDLAERLGDIYRPLLLSGAIAIEVNRVAVKPLEIRYLTTDEHFRPTLIKTQNAFGDSIQLRVGVLEEGQQSRVRPGLRFYYNGRLLEDGQFCGFPGPGQLPQAARFIGEVDLHFLKPSMNKVGFIKAGREWEETLKALRIALAPWMGRLAELRIEHKNELEEFEKEIAREAKRILEHIAGQTDLIDLDRVRGQARFRLPPALGADVIGPRSKEGRKSPRPSEGKTPPAIGADVGPEIKRKGIFYGWDTVPMGNEDIRCQIEIDDRGRERLKINLDHSMYQAAKRIGKRALLLYCLEIATEELGREQCQGQTVEEYLRWTSRALRYVGEHLRTRQ